MTQAPIPDTEESPEVTFSYSMASLNLHSPHQADEVLQEVGTWGKELFETALETAEKASGFRPAPPLERLLSYRTWDDLRWAEYRDKFPWRFEKTWNDWQALRLRARNGDFGPVEQAGEIAWSQQAEVGL